MSKLHPAALEFQTEARQMDERRPPWLERATLYALVAVIVTAIVGASIAKVDEIVVAQGKLVTTSATIVVQPLETSVVRTMDKKVGDVVRKGEVLATLDPTFSEADVGQLRDRITSLSAEIERLNAELDDRAYVPQANDADGALQFSIWTRHAEEYKARINSYDQQVLHAKAEEATKKADYDALVPRLAIAREVEAMRSGLLEQKLDSRLNYLLVKGQRLDVEREMQQTVYSRVEVQQDLKRIEADRAAFTAEFRQKVAEDLVQARRDRDSAVKQLEKAAMRNAVTVLVAPADAIVLEVAQRSVGSVMKEAEPLYTLVPLGSPLEAEVVVEGRDVGHVARGALVRMKLDAWPFQKNGTLSGQVSTVSNGSFNPDTKTDPQQRPYYKARVTITATELRDVPPSFHLIPGMAVTAEIKAGQRSVLSYFLYPLLRGLDESIREP